MAAGARLERGAGRRARSSTTWPGSRPSALSQEQPDDQTADTARLGAPEIVPLA